MTRYQEQIRDCGLFHPDFSLAASDETKRKMYSSILVVGGGLMFHGAQEFLLHRIINKMPPSFRRLVDNVEIITRPKVTKRKFQCVITESDSLSRVELGCGLILTTGPVYKHYRIWTHG